MKKIICLILCCAMFSMIPAYAVEESTESIYVEETTADVYVEETYEEYEYEEPQPEVCELTLYCNDQELKINTIPYKYADDAPKNYYSQSYQYITIANALGYETTYNEETAEITSVRDGRTIKIAIGEYFAEVTEGDKTDEIYCSHFTFEGRTYVTEYSLERLFDVNIYVSDYNEEDESDIPYVNLYEYKHFYNIFRTEFSEYSELLDVIFQTPKKNLKGKGKTEYSLEFKSDTFGTTIKGAGALEVNAEMGEDYIYYKVTSSTEGIFNLLKLFTYAADVYGYDEDADEEKPVIDFKKKDELEIYVTAESVYIKTNDLVNRLFNIDRNTKEKWIKVPDVAVGFMPDFTSSEFAETMKKEYLNNIVKGFIVGNEQLSYKDIIGKISEFSAMFDKKIIHYNEKNKTLKINCTPEEFKKIAVLFGAPEEFAEWFNLTVNTTDTLYDNGTAKGNGTVNYSLSNFPNPYGIEVGKVKFEMKITSETNLLKTPRPMPKPQDIIKIEENNVGEI